MKSKQAIKSNPQKMKLLKKEFWSLLQSNKYCPIYEEWENAITQSGALQRELLNKHFNIWSKTFRSNKNRTQLYLEYIIEEIQCGRMQINDSAMIGWYERVKLEVKSELHQEICQEIVDFLSAKSSQFLLYRCFIIAWADSVFQCQQGRCSLGTDAFDLVNLHTQMQIKHSQIFYQLAMMIVTTSWSEKFG